MRTVVLLCFAVFVVGGCATTPSGDQGRSDWPDRPERPWERFKTASAAPVDGWDAEADSDESAPTDSSLFALGYRFYTNGLTRVDGPRCEHRPTCSRYAYEAVQRHGAVIGTMMAIDRLFRTDRSSVHRQLPTAKFHEGTRYYADPVEENDFFL